MLAAEVLHGFASAMLPARHRRHEPRPGRPGSARANGVGRNSRFAALGNGVAAAVMGAVGTYGTEAAVFWLTPRC